ncbi:MAG: hypothetical protein AAGJ97_15700, partial [Planctomycetota bacterium]
LADVTASAEPTSDVGPAEEDAVIDLPLTELNLGEATETAGSEKSGISAPLDESIATDREEERLPLIVARESSPAADVSRTEQTPEIAAAAAPVISKEPEPAAATEPETEIEPETEPAPTLVAERPAPETPTVTAAKPTLPAEPTPVATEEVTPDFADEDAADDFELFAAVDLDTPQPEDDLVPDDDIPGYAHVPADGTRSDAPAELSPEQRVAAATPEESYRMRLLRRLEERAGLGGFQGFCPVVLRDARDLIDASPEHVSIFEAVAYEFSTSDARRRFRADPTRYAPVNGGHDVVLTAAGEVGTQGTLLHAAWYRDRLYLFRNPASLKIFQDNPSRFEMP